MKRIRIVSGLFSLFLFMMLCAALSAEEINCSEIHAIANMAKARSTTSLNAWKRKSGDSYRSNVIYASRYFELHPHNLNAAADILGFIPKSEEEDSVWHAGGVLLCKAESREDKTVLGKFSIRLPHDLAMAVFLVPDRMLDYVAYAPVSSEDPDSDYAVQMELVCRSKHQIFLTAVSQLSANTKKWFLSSTFNPDGCHALTFPEQ